MTILFLDFDGVLHADDVYRSKSGIALKSGGTLFEHAAILVAAIEHFSDNFSEQKSTQKNTQKNEPHPNVEIVLSTSWVRELGFKRAKKYLPPSLQSRVTGATYHSSFELDDGLVPQTPWRLLNRYEQIARHVLKHNIKDWLAVDNDNEGWPEMLAHRLVHTDDDLGLGELAAQQRLMLVLANFSEQKNTATDNNKEPESKPTPEGLLFLSHHRTITTSLSRKQSAMSLVAAGVAAELKKDGGSC